MKNEKKNPRVLLLSIAASLAVVLLIALMAFLSSQRMYRDGIVLPETLNPGADPGAVDDAGFVTVTTENAATLVESLRRPAAYEQTMTRWNHSDSSSVIATVQSWVCGGVTRISVTEGTQTRNVLTDGRTAYLWYADEPTAVRSVSLPEEVSVDDLSGILTYESIPTLPQDAILEAKYVQLAELDDAPCLFVLAREEGDIRFWVDLATGLLCRAECSRGEDLIYELVQTDLVLLNEEDPDLLEQLCLPDGTSPYLTEEAETPPA